jgi:hypothetical protein
MIAGDDELAAAHAKRAQEKQLLVRRLRTERALERPRDAEDPAELCAAVNRYLSAAPSPLLGISLDDVARETEPVNVRAFPSIAIRAGRAACMLVSPTSHATRVWRTRSAARRAESQARSHARGARSAHHACNAGRSER